MIETFTLKNFRCFREASISPLSKINLITGRNNSGKTAFLEGVFLHLGAINPELPLNINVFRGLARLASNAQEIWGWLFTDKDFQKTISLTSYDSLGKKRMLEINLEVPQSAVLGQNQEVHNIERVSPEIMTTASTQQQLVLSFNEDNGIQTKVAAQLTNNQIIFTRNDKIIRAPFSPSIFMATRIRNYAEDAERYSRLEEAGLHHEIIEALKQIEPKLKRFVVSVVAGIPSLRADLGTNKLIPLSYMGEGMSRILSIALAIPICQHGFLLIDELENGVYHSSLSNIFHSIYNLADKFNVQLLATTHSLECIRAAHEVYAQKDIYDFRLFEFEAKEASTQVTAYDRNGLEAILKNKKTS